MKAYALHALFLLALASRVGAEDIEVDFFPTQKEIVESVPVFVQEIIKNKSAITQTVESFYDIVATPPLNAAPDNGLLAS